jgi:hypothetical protein
MYMPTPLSEMNAAELDRYVIELCDSIKAAIEARGVTVGNAAVAEYGGLIRQIVGFLEAKTVSPSISQQVIEASQGYDGLSSVTVDAVDASIDENIQSQNIKDGVTILGVEGTYVPPATSLQNKSVTPTISAQEISADSGYDALGVVSVAGVTSSIDPNITEGNIKKDVAILGVVGSFEGGGGTIQLQDKTVTPTVSAQEISADSGYDGLGVVSVAGVTSSIDPNIVSGNIKKDVNILGVTGTFDGGGTIQLQDKSVTPSSSQQVITADSPYDGLGQVTVGAISLQSKSVVLSSSSQTITPDSGYTGLDQVNVPAVVLEPKSVTPSTSQQVINKSAGYDGIGTVTVGAVDASIDSSIQSQNIKAGITILGVVGSYTGGGGGSASQYVNTHPTKLEYAYSENSSAQNDLWNLGSIPELDTSAVTTMNNCFRSNKHVTILDLSTWSFVSCTDTRLMFGACTNLTKVTFPVNTPLKSIDDMFNNCNSLEEIAGSLNLSQCNYITATNSIFFGCTSLKKIQISDFSYNSNQTLDFSASTVFDAAYLLNSLPAYTGSRTKTIKVNSAVISQQLIDDYAAKGYTLTS